MKKTENITVEQAKQVLPSWLEFLNATSVAKLTAHPSVSKMVSVWDKHFAPVLDADYYQNLIAKSNKMCNWVSVGMDETDNTEKFIPTCDEGRGMPFKNSGYLKYCPFCGNQIGWTTSSLLGEPEEPSIENTTPEEEMNETNLYLKRQKIKEHLEANKLSLVDIGFDGNVTLENATEEMIDSVLDDIGLDPSDFIVNLNTIHILEVREIDFETKTDYESPSLAQFPNKTQFVVGVFSSKKKAVKWMKENHGFHNYDPSKFFYVLSWGRMNDFSPPIAEAFYDLNGDFL